MSKKVTFVLTTSIIVLLFMSFGLTGLMAQESVNAAGGNASGSGGTFSYSVGQVMYQTHAGTNNTVAEGVQQPYEISVATSIEEAIGINLSATAYPNPTTDLLQLKVESEKLKDLSFQLFDMNGKLLQTKRLTSTETQIDMSSYAPSNYFVKIVVKAHGNTPQQEVKTFKIIKMK